MDQPLPPKQTSDPKSSGPLFSGPKAPPIRSNSSQPLQKPVANAPSNNALPKNSSSASFSPDNVVIRTMKDDLQRGTNEPQVAAVQTPEPQKPANTKAVAAPQQLPVAPVGKANATSSKEKKVPATTSSGSRKVIMALSILLLLVGVGSAAVWWYLAEQPTTAEPEDGRVLSAHEVLPLNASLIIHYDLSTAQKRASTKALWDNNSSTNFLSGNPSALLDALSVSDIYYVLLPNDPRLFAVIPKNEATANYVTQYSEGQLYSIGNWYIVHTIAAQPYQQALQQGVLPQSINIASLAESTAIQWLFAPDYLAETYNRAVDLGLTATSESFIVLNAAYNSGLDTLTFTTSDAPISAPQSENELITAVKANVPGDSSFVWVGTSLREDTGRFVLPGFDGAVLNEPAVRELINQLDAPYAYYVRSGEDGARDIGLIISKPAALERELVNGDPVIERALYTLLPGILGRSVPENLELAFADAEYAGVPLRYMNLVGATQALDYAITSDFIYVASSKEGMFQLLDTAEAGAVPSIVTALPWQPLINGTEAITFGQSMALDTLSQELFSLLTGQPGSNVFMRASVTISETGREINGALLRAASQSTSIPATQGR